MRGRGSGEIDVCEDLLKTRAPGIMCKGVGLAGATKQAKLFMFVVHEHRGGPRISPSLQNGGSPCRRQGRNKFFEKINGDGGKGNVNGEGEKSSSNEEGTGVGVERGH